MPNWCNNTIEIEGTKEQIDKFVSFLEENNGKDWFNFFRPCPQELVDTVSGSVGEEKQSAHETQQKMNIEKYEDSISKIMTLCGELKINESIFDQIKETKMWNLE